MVQVCVTMAWSSGGPSRLCSGIFVSHFDRCRLLALATTQRSRRSLDPSPVLRLFRGQFVQVAALILCCRLPVLATTQRLWDKLDASLVIRLSQ